MSRKRRALEKSVVDSSPSLRLAVLLTTVIIIVAAVAAAAGLFIPGLYRDPLAIVAVNQGTDLVTLFAVFALAVALLGVRRGSARATLVWIGLLGYVFYIYTVAAFAYTFNAFFLLYVLLFSLSVFALIAAALGVDASAIQKRFDGATPRGPVAVFLILIALVLGVGELAQVGAFFVTGAPPELIPGTDALPNPIYTLDLGLIVPLAVVAAVWLWRRVPWGYILAGFILIKAATMGFALLSMTWFGARAGVPGDGLTAVWVVLAFGSLSMTVWFFRHCRDGAEAPLAPATPFSPVQEGGSL